VEIQLKIDRSFDFSDCKLAAKMLVFTVYSKELFNLALYARGPMQNLE
jgi:hypothetical protein